ncbi:hypothetical protein IOU64_004442 [Salmonella enterica]|nr:hypothetical protein [Salmonella enterica]
MDLTAFIAVSRSKGTTILEFADEPCTKCGCVHFYHRVNRKRGACVQCKYHINKQRDLTENTPNYQDFKQSYEVDENGVKVYYGKRCSKCGCDVRLAENAYGANSKKCRECALKEYNENQYGKEVKRLDVAVRKKANNFIIQSINQSGTVQVAPQNQYEYFSIRDLMWKCEAINQQNKALDTGIRWEIGHMFPASGGNTEYRGKATTDNLYLIQFEKNRKDGDNLPDSWTKAQVISFDECQSVMSLKDAAEKWRKLSGFDNMTPQEKKERTIKEREAQEAYKQRVREITQSALDSLPVLEIPNGFNESLENITAEWNKTVLRMSKQVDSFVQNENTMKWADLREQKLTVDAFQGATARTWIVKQTLEQIADTEAILQDLNITDEQQQMLDTVKRCAVMWGRDVLRTDKNLVMGFTHPLIDVLEGAKAWGTYLDTHTNKQWLCVWNGTPPAADNEQPYYDETDSIRKFSIKDSWKEGDEQFIYWTRKEKAIYEETEKRIAKRNQDIAERKKAEQERIERFYKSLLSILDTDLSHLEDYTHTLPPIVRGDAIKHLTNQYPIIDGMRNELIEINGRGGDTLQRNLELWEAKARCKMGHILNPDILFRDILQPY